MGLLNKYLINFRYAFQIRKPFLIARLVSTYLKILFLRRRPLRYVDFAVGYNCNLRCEHCFASALREDSRRKITPPEYRGIARQAMALGAVNFSFQGGEPILYPELLEFIKNAYPQRNLISVTTNATLLEERKILELKQAGVDILTISLDSADPDEHDRFRRSPGCFAQAMNAVSLALKNGLRVTLGAVVSRHNLKSRGFVDLIELARKLNAILFVALAAPLGEWAGNDSVVLTADDRRYLYHLVKKYPLLRTDFDANYVHRGCGAVKEILYLTPYGDVLGCPFLHFSLGNIFEESLPAVRNRALENPYFAHYHQLCLAAEDKEFMEKCRGPFYLRKSGNNVVRRLGAV